MYDGLADGVVVVHGAFTAFVVLGGLIAWLTGRRWVLAAHVAAVVWSIGLVVVSYDCPLTALERWWRRRGGSEGPTDGFVDRFLEGHLFPASATGCVQVGVVLVVMLSWVAWGRATRRREA